jgi:hypothetical protein
MLRATLFKAAFASFCWSAMLSSGSAHAEPSEVSAASKSAGAKELFKEGRKLVEKGDYEAGCSKFQQSLELEDGVGTRFNLADCYEKLGRTATSYELFIEVAEASKREGQTQREGVARTRAEAVAAKLSRLLVQVTPQERVVQVQRDGEPLDRSAIGTPVALDPGTYELSASAPGLEEWTSKVVIPKGPVVVQVTVPELEEKVEEPAPPVVKPEPAKAPVKPEANLRSERRLQTGAVILGSAGIASLVAAATFGIQYQTSNSDARAVCPASTGCSTEEESLHTSLVEDAKKARTLTYISVGAGTALLGTALYLYLNSAEDPSSRGVRAVPHVAHDGSVGASLLGSF